mmetsp:Transcript_29712/g.45519  ORF Transcript_29712/g.45519 Transcript_29712/m.45519 type:complete len:163 (+) Transcript_29712:21-509(+)
MDFVSCETTRTHTKKKKKKRQVFAQESLQNHYKKHNHYYYYYYYYYKRTTRSHSSRKENNKKDATCSKNACLLLLLLLLKTAAVCFITITTTTKTGEIVMHRTLVLAIRVVTRTMDITTMEPDTMDTRATFQRLEQEITDACVCFFLQKKGKQITNETNKNI